MARFGCMNGVVVALCVLTFFFGAVTFFAGLSFRLQSWIMGSEPVSFLNNIKLYGIPLGTMLLIHANSMMSLGGTIMVKSVIGLRAAVKTGKCALRLLIGLGITVILAQAVLVGMWLYTRIMTDSFLQGEMLNLLKEYRGPQYTDAISKGWNNLFMQGRCCGVVDHFANENTTGDFQDVVSEWNSTNKEPSEVVPATCCIGTDDNDISSKIASNCTTTPKTYYSEGCMTKLKEAINRYSLIHIYTAIGHFILQMLTILGSCMLLKTDTDMYYRVSQGS